MSLVSDVDSVLDLVEKPEQKILVAKRSYGECVEFRLPKLTLANSPGNADIKQFFSGQSHYVECDKRIVFNKTRQRSAFESNVMSGVVNKLQQFLEQMGESRRTKVSRWFGSNKYDIRGNREASEDLYQIWKYLNTEDGSNLTAKNKNVLGLLGLIINKYDGKI